MKLLKRRPKLVSTPVWFLDIDGVLAPFCGNDSFASFPTAWHGTVAYDPTIIRRIVAMVDYGLVTVEWLTSWDHDADSVFASSTGMPRFTVHAESEARRGGGASDSAWWKIQVATRSAGRKVVWTDDELGLRQHHQIPVTGEQGCPDHQLRLAPDSRYGLTHAHLDQIETFLTTNTMNITS